MNIIIFDVETTGTDRKRDQIIEMCVQFGLDEQSDRKVWRFKPKVLITPEAQKVHGITREELEGEPPFVMKAQEIRKAFDGADTVIGYNVQFDLDMLQAEFKRIGRELDLSEKLIVDPYRLWASQEPRSLQHAHKRFVGSDFASAHEAQADVMATGRILQGMLEQFRLQDESWESLDRLCNPEKCQWIGPTRHVQWSATGRVVLGFGKHLGRDLGDLARYERGYLDWIVGQDFPDHVKEICQEALLGQGAYLTDWVAEKYGRAG